MNPGAPAAVSPGGIFAPSEPLGQPLAFIDLETTGARPAADRITEIGIIEVEGGRVVSEWSTLVNPQVLIPAFIETLTGITNGMVADAPTFAELQDEVSRRLQGKLLIAHNVRFDHGFLRHEFNRLGFRFAARILCTVKLSRWLYPEHRRHNLDSLMQRHGLICNARHRALGDAQVLWQFVRRIAEAFIPEVIRAAVAVQLKSPSLPPGLRQEDLDDVPDGPGIYLFYDAMNVPLYVGRSSDMRARVLAHFGGDRAPAKGGRIAQQVARIDWIETAGELGARLQEAKLVRALQPIHNRQLRGADKIWVVRWKPEDGPDSIPAPIPATDIRPDHLDRIFGLFRSHRKAHDALRDIAAAHGLCPALLGLEPQTARGAPCSDHRAGICAGACCGKETPASHHLRLFTALNRLRLRIWPFRGRIAIRERARFGERNEVHLFDQWCWLGTAKDEGELAVLAESGAAPQFDFDNYQILVRHLERKAERQEVIFM